MTCLAVGEKRNVADLSAVGLAKAEGDMHHSPASNRWDTMTKETEMQTTQENKAVRVLAALTQEERADFFPEPLDAELERVCPFLSWVSLPPRMEDQAWKALLDRQAPEILVSAWGAPGLPASISTGGEGGLKYFCYLCGSVKKAVARSLIEKGLLVSNWGAVISDTVAECTLLLILSCLRRSTHWALEMHRNGGWKKGRHEDTRSLFERRVGLHGLGAISRALVSLLKPFSVSISAYSPSVPDDIFATLGVERAASLEELFSMSDVLVELAAATPKNHGVVTEDLLRSLPDGAVFVNTGRGVVVEEDALIRVAAEGRLLVGLDVYEKEPLPVDSPLRGMLNVTLIPHLGGPTRDRRQDCGKLAIQNINRYLIGEEPENLVTPEVFDRAT